MEYNPKNNKKIKIGFTFTDIFGNEFSASSYKEVFEDLGETDLDIIGEQLSAFLVQIGYIRPNGHILMVDLTEDEWCELNDYLDQLRSTKLSQKEES